MLKPGDKITSEELNRIEELSEHDKVIEIESIIRDTQPEEDLVEGFRAILHLYYENPDRYRVVPSPIRWNSKPLPYEGR